MRSLLAFALITMSLLACPNLDQRCAACNGDVCTVCYDSYLGQHGKCVAVTEDKEVDHCLQYSADAVCKICQHGYYESGGSCLEIELDDCIELNADKTCAMCKKGLKVINGICDDESECTLNECDYCNVNIAGQEVCSMCDDDYVLQNNNGTLVCVEETDATDDCIFQNEEGKCELCEVGYYYSNGVCEESDVYDLDMSAALTTIFYLIFALFF